MADVTIGELQQVTALDDSSLLPVEQGGQAKSVSGALLKQYARDGVEQYVSAAQQAAEDAQEYASKPAIIINGNWWIWNAEQNKYTDSGESAQGSATITIGTVTQGEQAAVTNVGTTTAAVLNIVQIGRAHV